MLSYKLINVKCDENLVDRREKQLHGPPRNIDVYSSVVESILYQEKKVNEQYLCKR